MFSFFRKKEEKKAKTENQSVLSASLKLTNSVEANIKLFKDIFTNDDTLIVRNFQNKYLKAAACCVIYIDGMVNTEVINENIIQPILGGNLKEEISDGNLLEELQYKVIASSDVKEAANINDLVESAINGDTVLLVEGYKQALIVSTKGWQTRPIDEPLAERVVRGPREGFVESLIINLSLIRRKIKNPDLKFQFKELGSSTKTKICLCYIEGVAPEKVLQELIHRLDNIEIDGIMDSGYIQELIKDAPLSPLETVASTERPDNVAGKLLEGRIAIVVDGSPFVLTLPFLFVEYFHADEDYYNDSLFTTVSRTLRMIGTFAAIFLPAIYVSLTTFHQEMIPTPLLLSITAARQGTPFPTILEAVIMGFLFEILRETGTRMPAPIGQTVVIVGALVLGGAAIEARFISAPMVIVSGLTGITALLTVKFKSFPIILRLLLLFLAFLMGFYGIIFGLIGLVIYFMQMRSYGVPYLLGTTAFDENNIKDTVTRTPWRQVHFHPRLPVVENHESDHRK
ncbi:spore germination protein [Desulfosporosinus shakirovi]|uniref:spore germination protein n=1 Tax=Desulfosporosinus shakirovi TaxID=2885154 RepID=UPI001E2AA689|nr:spore germination protein [Desulfosporosinus sp. SRJS8]MCB8817693.1 spore germination protein [Desulfosporosinus sp. SRJS8]